MKEQLARKVFRGLLIATFLWPTAGLCGDIYQCDNAFYDSSTLNREGCRPLRSSSVCGSDGNRYFSPSKGALPVVNERCQTPRDTPARSPFITMEKDRTLEEIAGAAPSEGIPPMRLNPTQSQGNNVGENKEFKKSLEKLFNVFECAADGLDGKTPDRQKCSNLITKGLTSGGR
jgi:hypothetical protein